MVMDSSSQIHGNLKKIICNNEKFETQLKPVLSLIDPSNEKIDEFPRIVLGGSKVFAWQSISFDGQEHELVLNICTKEGGNEEIVKISGGLMDIIHNADFKLEGHVLIDMQFCNSETRYNELDKMFHCKMVFKAITIRD